MSAGLDGQIVFDLKRSCCHWLHHFAFPPAVWETTGYSAPPHLVSFFLVFLEALIQIKKKNFFSCCFFKLEDACMLSPLVVSDSWQAHGL